MKDSCKTFPKLIDPKLCDPPHRVTHPEKYEELVEEFSSSGWNFHCPNLIGYNFGSRIQLITGSHRWAAASTAKILVPVKVYTYEYVYNIWGTNEWQNLIDGLHS